jgi:gliding motility-associated-like protein
MTRQIKIALLFILLPLVSYSQKYAQVTSLGYTHDLGTAIYEIDDAGNAYVIMRHYQPEWSSFLFPNGEADGSMVLAKLSPSGKLLWSKPFIAEVYFIKADPQENIYISGVGTGIKLDNGTTLAGGSFVLKLDKTGKALWGVVSETSGSTNTSGPIALAEDGIYWNASFYGKTKLQNRTLTAIDNSSPDSFVAKISSTGLLTALYHDNSRSIIQVMVEADNGNAAFIISRGGITRNRVILDKNCNVISDLPSFYYPDFPGKITRTPTGYEMLTQVGTRNSLVGYVGTGYYNIRFNKNLDVVDSVKIFEAYQPMDVDAGGKFIVDGVGSQETGFFLESLPKPYASTQKFDWLHFDQNYEMTSIADENPENSNFGDAISRQYVKMVGDTLHMMIRRFSYYYGNSFTLNNQTYTTPSNDNFSWFWAKYVYQDPDSCKKIKVQIVEHGKEGSQAVVVKLKLPQSCPATEDLVIPVSLFDPSKNQNDLTLPTQVIIKKGESSATLEIAVTDDNVMEPTETFTLSLSLHPKTAGYQLSGETAINPRFHIEDDDAQDQIEVAFPNEVEEGKTGVIKITIPNGKTYPVAISFNFAQTWSEFDADKGLDFSLPLLVLPAFTNTIQLSFNAFNDDLLEGDEFVAGSLSINSNTFKTFKVDPGDVKIKIIDPDNTYDNRVFYINPFVDSLYEGRSQAYTLDLNNPLKLQRPISLSTLPVKPLPGYVTQSATNMNYGPSGFTFAVKHVEDLILNKEKSVIFHLNATDLHTGDYRFWWQNEMSNTMEIYLVDNDNDFTELDAPNAFSPNGDGVNDTWLIKSLVGPKNCKVTIFNRYGVLVFGSTGFDVPWDGKFKGSDIAAGAYFYKVVVGDKKYSGNVNVIR